VPVSCDVAIHHLHLSEQDIGYFDSNSRFDPPLRSARDREALRAAITEGLAAICSDHTPVDADGKQLPFAEALPGATALELLLPLTLQLAAEENTRAARNDLRWELQAERPGDCRPCGLAGRGRPQSLALRGGCRWPWRSLAPVMPAAILGIERVRSALAVPRTSASSIPTSPGASPRQRLRSQGKNTPFLGYEMSGRVRLTLVGGRVVFEA
jgi:dihydroorotase